MNLRKTKVCSKCGKRKNINRFNKRRNRPDGLNCQCKTCDYIRQTAWKKANPDKVRAKTKRWHKRHPEFKMFVEAKRRARDSNIPFEITRADLQVPERCPALGIILKRHRKPKDNSPSLDRFKPEKGYVLGNVFVISQLANRIKNNATTDQVLAVGNWMKQIEEKQ